MRQFEIRSGVDGVRMHPREYRFNPESFMLGDEPLTPSTGVTADMKRTEEVMDTMKKRLLEAAAQTAVAQMAISIGTEVAFSAASSAAAAATAAGSAALAAGATASGAAIAAGSVVPIVGWAVAAVVAIGTLVGGHIGKKRAKAEVQRGKKEIQRYGDAMSAEIKAAQLAIAQEEYPAAVELAQSGQPLDGLGGLGSFLGIRKKHITKATAKAQVASVKYVGKAVLKTGEVGARLVGDERGVAKAKKWQRKWEANSDRVEKMFARKLENPYTMVARDLDTIGRTISGQQVVHVTREKVNELVKKARQDMDEYRDKTLAAMNTAEYREAVRVNIAKGLRGDPEYAAQVRQLEAQDKMVDAEFMSSQQVGAAEIAMARESGLPVPTGKGDFLTTAATIASLLVFR